MLFRRCILLYADARLFTGICVRGQADNLFKDCIEACAEVFGLKPCDKILKFQAVKSYDGVSINVLKEGLEIFNCLYKCIDNKVGVHKTYFSIGEVPLALVIEPLRNEESIVMVVLAPIYLE